MGTWNATPFGNDTAMDWLSRLHVHVNGRDLLLATLAQVKPGDDTDTSEAEEVVAAAAVIVAAATDPIGAIGADTKQWIAISGFVPDPELLAHALQAIDAVRTKSELRDLWEESGGLKEWLKQIDTLKERIERACDSGIPIRTPKIASMPRSLHKMLALYACQPDPKLRQKIQAKVVALKNPNDQTADTDFQTPLALLARYGLLPETLHLLASGADPNSGTSHPFADACVAGHLDVASALYSAGAVLFHESRVSPDTGIAVHVAVKDANEPVQGHRYCLALFAVARKGSPMAADYLRGIGASIEQTDINGETLLHKAAEAGCLPMIHYLLDSGLDPSSTKGQSGETPLHYAVRAGQVAAVRALLERNANPNAIDRFVGEVHQWSETPLDIAELPEIRQLLIAHGAHAAG